MSSDPQGWGRCRRRMTVYRILVRHGLVEARKRGRRREDYKRWERDAPMALWQLDIVGGVFLMSGPMPLLLTARVRLPAAANAGSHRHRDGGLLSAHPILAADWAACCTSKLRMTLCYVRSFVLVPLGACNGRSHAAMTRRRICRWRRRLGRRRRWQRPGMTPQRSCLRERQRRRSIGGCKSLEFLSSWWCRRRRTLRS